ncbi:MAG TPA: CUAEP/CCAEP-tail radical SAM protein [Candidatus Acidoferrum sp.]|nr:CUAEP/CCAEP-tail radical SAM protein [Candidatus Acidoferrum sp.]
MNIVLISTYELGRQPFGLVSPAAWLRKRGHSVRCIDLTRETLDAAATQSAELIAIYLPMHTATRLAVKLLPRLRELNPDAHLCCYGLYAPMNADYLRSLGVVTILGGEFEQALANLADHLAQPDAPGNGHSSPLVSLERLSFEVPDRSGMPPLAKYAHLVLPGGGSLIVGSTEASRGCKHLCRHCPIVPVYKGVFRIVNRDVVLEDVRRQIAAGAQHISFGDPDFFNGIRHSLELIEQFHREFPGVTYDATIKIEHLKKYEHHLPALKQTGCLFVISAVESLDDSVLRALDKGHTREDFLHVVRAFRELGLILHPTFVPFTQWTTLESYLDLLQVLHSEGLIENVAPIQLGIRMLIPEGSRLLELEEVQKNIGPFDPESLFYPWKHADPRVDALAEAVQAIAADCENKKESRTAIFKRIWEAAHFAAGLEAPLLSNSNSSAVPFLSEPWYCCAEPTKQQFVSIGQVPQKVQESTPASGSYT